MTQKRSTLLIVLVLLFVLNTATVRAVDYSSLVETKARSIVPVKYNVKMTVNRQGKSNTRTINGRANGLLINDQGLVLISARQLKGPAMLQQNNRPGLSIETVARRFETRMPDGSWLTTELSARDSGLDLAFLRVKESLEAYDDIQPLEFPEGNPSLEIGEEIIHISRFRKGLNFEPHLLITRISGKIEDPRLRYSLMDGPGMLANFIGSAGFNGQGQFVGMATFRGDSSGGSKPGGGGNPFANMSRNQQFLLPAEDIQQAVSNYRAGRN